MRASYKLECLCREIMLSHLLVITSLSFKVNFRQLLILFETCTVCQHCSSSYNIPSFLLQPYNYILFSISHAGNTSVHIVRRRFMISWFLADRYRWVEHKVRSWISLCMCGVDWSHLGFVHRNTCTNVSWMWIIGSSHITKYLLYLSKAKAFYQSCHLYILWVPHCLYVQLNWINNGLDIVISILE
jgi:hypothetical protein